MQMDDAGGDLGQMLAAVPGLIRAGEFEALAQVSAVLADALASLGPADAPRLAALRAQAAANLVVLDGAARGVRAARVRVSEVMAAQTGVTTYDRSGARQVLRTTPGASAPHRR